MTIDYAPAGTGYDEMFEAAGTPRRSSVNFVDRLASFTPQDLIQRQQRAEQTLHTLGITFTVYGEDEGTERIWPFDLLPRIIAGQEWARIEQGLKQRVHALNLFIQDIYNEQRIIKDGTLPAELIHSCASLRPQLIGFRPPQDVWCHISGVDLVRDGDGTIYVLEDNLRCPSGVSYVLENRELMKRTFPQVFEGMSVSPVEDYPEQLLDTLLSCAPAGVDLPCAVLLTPGIYNSAYFEHTYLAQQMGIQLVQGSDLLVRDNRVFMRTTHGLQRVDVIYRRIDDDFLDPTFFRPDSTLGVAGLMEAYLSGNVTLANAPGCGVADDKAIYAYVPDIIRYYLAEDAILSNVPTFVCADSVQRDHVLSNLDKLVVKPTNESGGYGILMGPMASQAERDRCADAVRTNPRNYIAQPLLQLSTVPTLIGDQVHPRHVDLRPFVLSGKDIYVMPGGLTRVALRAGSMVVNSSQGGGSKDTWVLRDRSLRTAPHIATAEQKQSQTLR
ncbi:MAG: circularly permuted type 2 ATP-grasp protein [Planctomycetales bacterium]|nr:circularly permuted type 2 ATP-grasp protein [Planctomycetales bacterium]